MRRGVSAGRDHKRPHALETLLDPPRLQILVDLWITQPADIALGAVVQRYRAQAHEPAGEDHRRRCWHECRCYLQAPTWRCGSTEPMCAGSAGTVIPDETPPLVASRARRHAAHATARLAAAVGWHAMPDR